MGAAGGIQFNGVARLEARFAEDPGGQFQRGDVACVHVDAGEVDDARGRLIARRTADRFDSVREKWFFGSDANDRVHIWRRSGFTPMSVTVNLSPDELAQIKR